MLMHAKTCALTILVHRSGKATLLIIPQCRGANWWVHENLAGLKREGTDANFDYWYTDPVRQLC